MTEANLIVPVILAGGQGTRLWPMSRAARPKQFLPLTGPTSLYQQTLLRVADPARYQPAVIVTNAEYRFLVAEQAQEADVATSAVLLEPVARGIGDPQQVLLEYRGRPGEWQDLLGPAGARHRQ